MDIKEQGRKTNPMNIEEPNPPYSVKEEEE